MLIQVTTNQSENNTTKNMDRSFYNFAYAQLLKKKDQISAESFYTYKTAFTKIEKFHPGVTLDDLSEEFIAGYRQWMLAHGNNENTCSKSLRTLRTFTNLAVRYGYLKNNPFQWVRIKKVSGKRDFLTIDEFQILEALYTSLVGIEKEVCRCFLFSCTTGIRYGDMKRFSFDNIENNQIQLIMHKTGLPVTIPVSKKAAAYLYEENWFRVYCNKVTNRVLRLVRKKAGIEKRLTFHVARHTFATISITIGMPIEVVSKLLGHTDIKTTQIYAKVVDSLKQKEMKKWDF